MDLKDKAKIVQVIGAAESSLAALEERIHALEAQGKTPAKEDRQLLKGIQRALDRLKLEPFAGDAVPHALWPTEYAGLPNLFRLELSRFWRLLYYVTGNDVMVVSVVFEITDHPHYDKIFGYKKK